jgi:hypothetical protein
MNDDSVERSQWLMIVATIVGYVPGLMRLAAPTTPSTPFFMPGAGTMSATPMIVAALTGEDGLMSLSRYRGRTARIR